MEDSVEINAKVSIVANLKCEKEYYFQTERKEPSKYLISL
jgi:hypothetical protein